MTIILILLVFVAYAVTAHLSQIFLLKVATGWYLNGYVKVQWLYYHYVFQTTVTRLTANRMKLHLLYISVCIWKLKIVVL